MLDLKFISKPIFQPPKRKYESNWASWTGKRVSTHFNSTTTVFSTTISTLNEPESKAPLYTTGNGTCRRNDTPSRVSSIPKASSYIDSSKPDPSSRCTAMAHPIIFSLSVSSPTIMNFPLFLTLFSRLRVSVPPWPYSLSHHSIYFFFLGEKALVPRAARTRPLGSSVFSSPESSLATPQVALSCGSSKHIRHLPQSS